MDLTSDDWKNLQQKTHEYGQGVALVGANERLITQAIANDVKVDGSLDRDYNQFGLTAGVLERNYVEGVIGYAGQLDADSEEYNRWKSTGRSSTAFASSLDLSSNPYVAAGLGVFDIAAGHFGLEDRLGTNEDTNHQNLALDQQLENYIEDPPVFRYGNIAEVEAIRAAQNRGEQVVDSNCNHVKVVDVDGASRVEVKIDGEWTTETPTWKAKDERPEGLDIGDTRATTMSTIGEPQHKAAADADPDQTGSSDLSGGDGWE